MKKQCYSCGYEGNNFETEERGYFTYTYCPECDREIEAVRHDIRSLLGIPGQSFICLDDRMIEKLHDLIEWAYDGLESASEIDADRGMSAVAMGFNPYDINRTDTSAYKRTIREVNEILGGSEKLHEMIEESHKKHIKTDVFGEYGFQGDSDDLPF